MRNDARGPAAVGTAGPDANHRRTSGFYAGGDGYATPDVLPPQDLMAEAALLGSIMLDGAACLPKVRAIVPAPDAFIGANHGALYSALVDMHDAGSPFDLVTVRNALERRGILQANGATFGITLDFLTELVESVPSAAHAEYYARIVLKKYQQRLLMQASQRLYEAAASGGAESIRTARLNLTAIQAGDPSSEFPDPVPASALGDGQHVAWLWFGYLAAGFITLFTGLWKSGKTTLITRLLRLAQSGGDLAGTVAAFKALVVSEEASGLWARRRDAVGLANHVHFAIKPFKSRPDSDTWRRYCAWLAGRARTCGYALVVIDTVAGLLPITDENSAVEMADAIAPLAAITEAGAAVMLVHHPGKRDAGEATASRGSGALPGAVDVIVELRRFDGASVDDRRRVLRGYSRFDETPAEQVVELREDGYRALGTRANARQADRKQTILDMLPEAEPGKTLADLMGEWPDAATKPSRKTLASDLEQGVERGDWTARGRGVRGEPRRFWIMATAELPQTRILPQSTGDDSGNRLPPYGGKEAGCHNLPAPNPDCHNCAESEPDAATAAILADQAAREGASA